MMINYFIKINEYYFFTLHFFYICIELFLTYTNYHIFCTSKSIYIKIKALLIFSKIITKL